MSATMTHFTTPQFWQLYNTLLREVQQLADKNFELLKADPNHSSLRLKKVGSIGRHGLAYIIGCWQWSGRRVWSGFGLALMRFMTRYHQVGLIGQSV